MRRLTSRQLLNHFANFPNVRIDYSDENRQGPWNVHSINARNGEWVIALVPAPGAQAGPGLLFRVPISDLDNPMWDIFSA